MNFLTSHVESSSLHKYEINMPVANTISLLRYLQKNKVFCQKKSPLEVIQTASNSGDDPINGIKIVAEKFATGVPSDKYSYSKIDIS